MRNRRATILLGVAGLGLLAAGCPVTTDAPCSKAPPGTKCPADEDAGGLDGGGSDVVVPPGCDLTKSPKDSTACVDDAVAIFVSPAGDDAATGSKAAPVKSITKGVELASARGLPRVYVCEGDYADSVELTKAVDLFGGLTCDWKPSGAPAKWSATKPAFALRIAGVSDRIVIEDFAIQAKDADAQNPGESSIGAFVAESKDVSFVNVTITAGRGADGLSPTQKAQASNAPKATAAAAPPNTSGSAGAKNTCPDGDSTGGNGGTVGLNDGSPGLPALGAGQPGAVGTDCGTGGAGKTGADGAPGLDAPKGTSLGELTATEWTPASGPAGKAGTRAQGGGGGGARTGAGGGGGAGGCGGSGGDGGGGGGASVALAIFSSKLTLTSGKLSSASAGKGGGGAKGQLGQPFGGGGGGATATPADGCPGGQGGQGGAGGGGAGGAAGVAPAVLLKGGTLTKDDASVLTVGTAGGAGKGSGAANDGATAPTDAIVELP